MVQNDNYRNLTHSEMQELLPDYVFGRISAQDKADFENNLNKYPDIQSEVDEVRGVFSRLDTMNIDERISKKTRNLSVKINEKMFAKNRTKARGVLSWGFIAPSLAVIIIAFLMITGKLDFNFGKKQAEPKVISKLVVIKPSEASVLVDSTVTEKEIIQVSSGNLIDKHTYTEYMSGLDKSVTNMFDTFLKEELLRNISGLDDDSFSYLDLIQHLNTIDESEFQEILKELDNVTVAF